MRRSRWRISATSSAAKRRRVRGPVLRGRTARSSWAAVSASSSRGAPPGSSWVSSTCSRFTVWVRVLTTSSRCSTRARSAVIASSTATVRSPAAVSAAMPTEVASASSVLRPCPVDSIRTRAASLAGTSTADDPVGGQPGGQRCTQPAGTLDRPHGGGPAGGELGAGCGSRLAADRHPDRGQRLQRRSSPRPRSTTPCADRSAITTRLRLMSCLDTLTSSTTPNSGHEARRAYQLRAVQTSLEPLPPTAPTGTQAV